MVDKKNKIFPQRSFWDRSTLTLGIFFVFGVLVLGGATIYGLALTCPVGNLDKRITVGSKKGRFLIFTDKHCCQKKHVVYMVGGSIYFNDGSNEIVLSHYKVIELKVPAQKSYYLKLFNHKKCDKGQD